VKGDGGSGFPSPDPVLNAMGRKAIGVLGTCSDPNGAGIKGENTASHPIVGETQSDAHAGVTGRNLTSGGVGIYGEW